MVRCGRVVAMLTEKSAQTHTANATNQNLRELAMGDPAQNYWKGPKIEY